MLKKIIGARRLVGFDKPTIWSIMTPLAIKTNSINLGQGFPSWSPPDFYLENLDKAQKQSNHQYQRAFGSLPLVRAIANYHHLNNKLMNIDPENQIVVVNGGAEGLFSSILAFIDEGDQVIFFDPAYDCYRAQIQMAGGISIGIPLKPKYQQSKTELKMREKNGFISNQVDDWDIDYEMFRNLLSDKTKMVILNSPHNPSGKVFTSEEISRLAAMISKYPRIIVLEDNVYEGMTFDDTFGKHLPKISLQPGFAERSLSVYSAGKIFAATGVRNGWVIGHSSLIECVRSVHQYNVFCSYGVIENTVAKSLHVISDPQNTYMREYSQTLTRNRNFLLSELIASKYNLDLWIPKGGYFIMAGISRCKIDDKYMVDEYGNRRPRDYAFCLQLAYEQRVVAIPCSVFYSKKDQKIGEQYVRFAFCKDEESLIEAGKRMR